MPYFGKSLQVAPVVEFLSLYTGGEDDNKVLVFAHHHNMMNGYVTKKSV